MNNNPNNYTETYGGYLISVDTGKLEYKIIETLSTGKKKVRRHCNGTTIKPQQKDQFGNKYVNGFTDFNHCLKVARNFIDNYIVPWEEKRQSFGITTPLGVKASVTINGKPDSELVSAVSTMIDLAYKNLP